MKSPLLNGFAKLLNLHITLNYILRNPSKTYIPKTFRNGVKPRVALSISPDFCAACPQNRTSRSRCWNERIEDEEAAGGFDAQRRRLPICPHHSAGGSDAPKEGMMPGLGWGRCSSSRHRPRERLLVLGRLMRTKVLTEGPELELDACVCVCV